MTEPPPIRTAPRPTCLACGRAGEPLYSGLRDRLFGVPGEWSSRRCPDPACGLVWLDPCPVPADIPRLYSNYYTHTADGEGDPLTRIHNGIARRVLPAAGYAGNGTGSVVGKMFAACGPIRETAVGNVFWLDPKRRGSVLDVGCGAGDLLKWLAGAGWDVAGIEPDPVAAEVARGRGLDVTTGMLTTDTLPPRRFDVVTLSHVLEHLPDPVATLSACRMALKPGGQLVVATPNAVSNGVREFEAAWLGWDPPRHLLVYTPGSLTAVLKAAGFADVRVTTPSRMARSYWRYSRQIRDHGAAPNGHCGFQPWLWPASYLFHLCEYRMARRRPVGEELLGRATAPAG